MTWLDLMTFFLVAHLMVDHNSISLTKLGSDRLCRFVTANSWLSYQWARHGLRNLGDGLLLLLFIAWLLSMSRVLWVNHWWFYLIHYLGTFCCRSRGKFCLSVYCGYSWTSSAAQRTDCRNFLGRGLILHSLKHHWLLMRSWLLVELGYHWFLDYYLCHLSIWLILSFYWLFWMLLCIWKLLSILEHGRYFLSILNWWVYSYTSFFDFISLLLVLDQAHCESIWPLFGHHCFSCLWRRLSTIHCNIPFLRPLYILNWITTRTFCRSDVWCPSCWLFLGLNLNIFTLNSFLLFRSFLIPFS